jgi:hypothetical protein
MNYQINTESMYLLCESNQLPFQTHGTVSDTYNRNQWAGFGAVVVARLQHRLSLELFGL